MVKEAFYIGQDEKEKLEEIAAEFEQLPQRVVEVFGNNSIGQVDEGSQQPEQVSGDVGSVCSFAFSSPVAVTTQEGSN